MPNDSHAQPIEQILLALSNWRPLRHVEDPLNKDLSGVARVGDSLFLVYNETASVERLRRMKDCRFGEYQHFALDGLVGLPAGAEGEMDTDGLYALNDFLWNVGWHPLKRSKPKQDDNACGG